MPWINRQAHTSFYPTNTPGLRVAITDIVKHIVRRCLIPIVLLSGCIALFSFNVSAQNTLKLDLKKGIEKEIPSCKRSIKAKQKLVQKIEVETSDGSETMYFLL